MLDELGQSKLPVIKDQALNERDYGDLVGLNKDDARKKWGEEQVHIWRRSYDVAPPGGESLARHRRARAALLHPGNPAARAARRARAGLGARQFAARAGDGAREADAGEILKREIATGVPIIYRLNADFDGEVEARSGGVVIRRRHPGFPAEHRALARQAPVIAGDVAALADARDGTAPRSRSGSCRPRRRPRARPSASRPCAARSE